MRAILFAILLVFIPCYIHADPLNGGMDGVIGAFVSLFGGDFVTIVYLILLAAERTMTKGKPAMIVLPLIMAVCYYFVIKSFILEHPTNSLSDIYLKSPFIALVIHWLLPIGLIVALLRLMRKTIGYIRKR